MEPVDVGGVGAVVCDVLAEDTAVADDTLPLLALSLRETPPGIALATRLASNSTKTTSGFNSRTIVPANSADAEDICAVPNMWIVLMFVASVFTQVETDGSQRVLETSVDVDCLDALKVAVAA